jgi:uncharacterized damage-inducible protein DinB
MTGRRKDLLLALLRVAGDAQEEGWHASLLRTLDGVDAAAARWTPAPDRPSVWALVRHVTLWKTALMEAMDHGYVDPSPFEASDWGELPADAAAWDADRSELARVTRLVEQRVAAADDRLLDREVDGLGGTLAEQIAQLATHDAYHAGQIRGLLRLREARFADGDVQPSA